MHCVPDGCLRPMEAVVITHVELFNLFKRCGNNNYWYLWAVAAREWLNYIGGLNVGQQVSEVPTRTQMQRCERVT